MVQISYNKLWYSKFDDIVSKKDNVQDMNFKQLKLQVHDSYKNDKIRTTYFEPVNDEDVLNKAYLVKTFIKMDGHVIIIRKNYKDFKILFDKQSIEMVLIQRAVKTTIQVLYDEGLFKSFPNADEVLKDFLFVTRREGDLEERN